MIAFIFLLLGQINETDKIIQIQKEIQILNLINGLELSRSQVEFILEKALEVEEMKDNFSKEIGNYERTVLQTLSQLKKNRIANQELSDDLRKSVHYAEGKLHDYRLEMFESIEKIVHEVENILDGNQIYQLEHYIPCLIPPPGQSRVGQSEKPLGIIHQLKRIRNIPDWLYEAKKYEIADRTVERIKKHLARGAEFNEDAERNRILELFDEMRSIDDVDFAVKQEDYAERLKGKYLTKEIPLDLSFKIERFLLNPLTIPLLEEKIKGNY